MMRPLPFMKRSQTVTADERSMYAGPYSLSLSFSRASWSNSNLNILPTYLQERLMHPIEGNTLSSYITTYLTQVAHASELLLYLSKPGNLDSQDWSALFEAPDSPDEARQQGWDLNPAETDQIIRTLRAAAEECGAQLGTLYNPLEQRQNPLMHTGSNKLPDRNDDDTDAQWTAQGLRLLARIPPAGPADISELRVCVAGNVDSGEPRGHWRTPHLAAQRPGTDLLNSKREIHFDRRSR